MDTSNDPGGELSAGGGGSISPGINGGNASGTNGGFWSAFSGLGKTGLALATVLNQPSAADIAAAQARNTQKTATTLATYMPFILLGLVALGAFMFLIRRR